jgi:aldose 1-epimerase
MIEKTLFGKLSDGREVFLFSLKNEAGTEIQIINYGAIVKNLFVKDKNNKIDDVVLGYDSLNDYVNDSSYFGAVVGRYGNRIAKGKFKLDGKEYNLDINNGKNHLHGGKKGFFKVLWHAEPFVNEPGASLKLTYLSKDGEEGYPGTVSISVIYTLTEENDFVINYEAKSDKPTIINPTHHSYFNLTGDFTKTILDHELQINADKYAVVDKERIPTGEITNVKNTPMDFTTSHAIGLNINKNYEPLNDASGYDCNMVLNNYDSTIKKAASVFDPLSGRLLEVFTDQPGLQFYSGNFLEGVKGKNGMIYKKNTGLCLEAQHFPDSPNKPEFPSTVLRPGEIYKQTTIYKFSVK